MNIIAIDGGVHKCAVACFESSGPVWCGFMSGPGDPREAIAWCLDLVVVERPVIRGNNTPNPQDIVDLAWESATLAYSFGVPVKALTPQEWKGQVPKPVHHARVLFAEWPTGGPTCLPEGWRERVMKACLKGGKDSWAKPGAAYYGSWQGHNLLDAVALGLYARKSLTP